MQTRGSLSLHPPGQYNAGLNVFCMRMDEEKICMATNRRRTTRTTRTTRSSGLRTTAQKVYPTPGGEAAAAAPAPMVDWDKEYHYILKDLRQLGIVSAVLVVLLLVAGFLI